MVSRQVYFGSRRIELRTFSRARVSSADDSGVALRIAACGAGVCPQRMRAAITATMQARWDKTSPLYLLKTPDYGNNSDCIRKVKNPPFCGAFEDCRWARIMPVAENGEYVHDPGPASSESGLVRNAST